MTTADDYAQALVNLTKTAFTIPNAQQPHLRKQALDNAARQVILAQKAWLQENGLIPPAWTTIEGEIIEGN